MTILTKFLAVKNAISLHPIVLKTCRTTEEFIACLDSNIHFSKVHEAADKKLLSYPIGKLFNRYQNILIEEEGCTMWHLKEAAQATSFYPLAEKGVVEASHILTHSKVNFVTKQPNVVLEENLDVSLKNQPQRIGELQSTRVFEDSTKNKTWEEDIEATKFLNQSSIYPKVLDVVENKKPSPQIIRNHKDDSIFYTESGQNINDEDI